VLTEFTLPSPFGATPLVWFGLIQAISLVAGIAVVGVLRRRVDVERGDVAIRTLLWLNAGVILGVAGFALAPQFSVAIAFFAAVSVLRRASGPVESTWLNHQIPSAVRATVLSAHTQADSLGQFIGGPALGGVGRVLGVRFALLVTAGLLVPVQALYRLAGRAVSR
jgi:DHA3 family tetracycline resistance protein-like MFS transporter